MCGQQFSLACYINIISTKVEHHKGERRHQPPDIKIEQTESLLLPVGVHNIIDQVILTM